MKGIVFTEFLEMIENKFSPEMADRIIERANLQSRGIYTAVGTYDHSEMIELVSHLSNETGIPSTELMRSFGMYLFERFYAMFPVYFDRVSSSFDFLQRIEGYIHVEVRKLYPEAELPSFACGMPRPGCLRLTYRSARPFAVLAEGLIRGCVAHYGEAVDITVEDLSDGTGTAARFLLTKRDLPP
jgi:Haem-NO-binding